ncbi:MAG: hypothetical protein EZS28_040318, partial [Streblomastix strix]
MEQIKQNNPTFMIKKANGKRRKILNAKALNKKIADFHFKMHDSYEVRQTIRRIADRFMPTNFLNL